MWYTALIMGFVGSLHCIGMCSPLAMMATSSPQRVLLKRIVYNISRIVPYGLLGALAGSFGTFLQFPKLQLWLTLGFGVGLVLVGVSTTLRSLSFRWITPFVGKFVSKIKILFSRFLVKKTWSSFLLLGLLNGFIPCGLTYTAASYCILLPDGTSGLSFMIVFGIGTLPAMIGGPFILKPMIQKVKFDFAKITSIMIIILGCVVIARAALTNYQVEKVNAQVSVCK